ncbi:MAG: D-alanyl-D-alanine carboxypeptidase [Geminicoccaceae bacterium]|nr:D-alanyl-D-alanine carboxypeptidase [Geminicoccaceae bacterium]
MASGQRIAVSGFLLVVALAISQPAHAQNLTSIVVEYPSGKVLSESGADVVTYPASLTKMMTLYLTFEALRAGRVGMATRLSVSAEAARQPPSKLGLRPGSTIRLDEAIRALAVKSANDVAVVLAEGIGGSEARFAQLMSYRARELGMTRTRFVNASGLPDERQRTTARDMAVLASRLLSDFPEYYGFFGLPYFVWKGRTYHNHNRLLATYPGMDGLKTGYIRASGYNLAASAMRNGRRLVAVVLGGASSGERNREMVRLLDEAFAIGPPANPVAGPFESARPTTAATGGPTRPPAEASAPSARPKRPTTLQPPADFGVQLGAFRDRRTAGETARRIARTLPTLRGGTVIVAEPRSRSRKYVAQVVGLNRADALGACASLRRAGKPCLVLAPNERAVGSR